VRNVKCVATDNVTCGEKTQLKVITFTAATHSIMSSLNLNTISKQTSSSAVAEKEPIVRRCLNQPCSILSTHLFKQTFKSTCS